MSHSFFISLALFVCIFLKFAAQGVLLLFTTLRFVHARWRFVCVCVFVCLCLPLSSIRYFTAHSSIYYVLRLLYKFSLTAFKFLLSPPSSILGLPLICLFSPFVMFLFLFCVCILWFARWRCFVLVCWAPVSIHALVQFLFFFPNILILQFKRFGKKCVPCFQNTLLFAMFCVCKSTESTIKRFLKKLANECVDNKHTRKKQIHSIEFRPWLYLNFIYGSRLMLCFGLCVIRNPTHFWSRCLISMIRSFVRFFFCAYRFFFFHCSFFIYFFFLLTHCCFSTLCSYPLAHPTLSFFFFPSFFLHSRWVPITCGSGAVLIGFMYPTLDTIFQHRIVSTVCASSLSLLPSWL